MEFKTIFLLMVGLCFAQDPSANVRLSYSAPNGHYVVEDRSIDGTSVLGNFGYQSSDGQSVGVAYGSDGAGFVIGSPSTASHIDQVSFTGRDRGQQTTTSGPEVPPSTVSRGSPVPNRGSAVSRGSAVVRSGPAVVRSGPALPSFDPVAASRGSAVVRSGPALPSFDPVAASRGSAVSFDPVVVSRGRVRASTSFPVVDRASSIDDMISQLDDRHTTEFRQKQRRRKQRKQRVEQVQGQFQ